MEGLKPDGDVQLVIGLELRLLEPQVRASAGEPGGLLHPDFVEFGASGRMWDRSQIIASLTKEQPAAWGEAPERVLDITGTRLADDVVHVTYLSLRDRRCALRSSIWRRTNAGWRLYFHQGTPTQSA
jgi:hypothetical protein